MKNCIVVRGAGDLATAVIHKLHNSGFKVIALEIEEPLAIRRQISFCEAVYEKKVIVEGVECILCNTEKEIEETLSQDKVALIIDPKGEMLSKINPIVLVDGILAKKNLGTTKDMAPLTIALGPGFCAGEDVDIVIETMRGHNLGRVITDGRAEKNTGIPGAIKGFAKERVMHSQHAGIMENVCKIGDIVEKGDLLCYINDYEKKHEVRATIPGVLRGLLKDGAKVNKSLKILDIDPRKEEVKNAFTISDKARCIAGGVLEAILNNGIYPKN
ncbi:selenium-dependent molybdenum cofactor biosynthesis protein YqeB [Clostridioides difficile]|uniref:selenium-dependent molybdenum cofactor biosynthesis protein YqeB n=1 Tax=unclassified Clostridioides TaxID=2635829 RepID=UPI0006BBF890|nr:molybdenum hydroxylase [Clostridioides difficile]MCI9977885.1 EF2563 family selenium-dependent molybdenum hydroxylase system protein [Clostridioides difficile]MDI0267516.1 selenium-dependent molybdenum cofactor biosynthesis protein YqeB [Clostridioides difficile]